jgi:hypothetical protein
VVAFLEDSAAQEKVKALPEPVEALEEQIPPIMEEDPVKASVGPHGQNFKPMPHFDFSVESPYMDFGDRGSGICFVCASREAAQL